MTENGALNAVFLFYDISDYVSVLAAEKNIYRLQSLICNADFVKKYADSVKCGSGV